MMLPWSGLAWVGPRGDGKRGFTGAGQGFLIGRTVRSGKAHVDFGYSQITVRDGKGEKDRVTILPALLQANLLAHLERVKEVHQKDLE